MQKIIPNIWCNGNAREIAEFYAATFPNSSITGDSKYPMSTEEGLADFQVELAGKDLTVEFKIEGFQFVAINAGPEFKPNSSISFMVYFDPNKDGQSKEYLTRLYEKLIAGGEAIMPLDTYDFSEWYGWVKDTYGFNWQLILMQPQDPEFPRIVPSLQFAGPVQNKAKEAIDFYTSVFENSKRGIEFPYGETTGSAGAENLAYADFTLGGQWFAANDSGVERDITFNEGISLQINCKDQAEIDYFWEKLSSHPENEQCGWCKDMYGVAWQVVPENTDELMKRPNAYAKLMQMKKIIIADF